MKPVLIVCRAAGSGNSVNSGMHFLALDSSAGWCEELGL